MPTRQHPHKAATMHVARHGAGAPWRVNAVARRARHQRTKHAGTGPPNRPAPATPT